MVHLPKKTRTLTHLDVIDAKWVVVREKSYLGKNLANATSTWELVGEVDKKINAYRRR